MRMIQTIYETMYLASKPSHQTEKLEERILQIASEIEGGDPQEKEFIQQLFFQASTYGQQAGFHRGFSLAVTLMAESFLQER